MPGLKFFLLNSDCEDSRHGANDCESRRSLLDHFLSLDWIAGQMRYQLDRKFGQLDGSLSSLELTEMQKSNAEKFLPDFPHQGGALPPCVASGRN